MLQVPLPSLSPMTPAQVVAQIDAALRRLFAAVRLNVAARLNAAVRLNVTVRLNAALRLNAAMLHGEQK